MLDILCTTLLIFDPILVISIYLQAVKNIVDPDQKFGPSIKGLVTDGNTKFVVEALYLALFRCTTAFKIDQEHT